MNNMFTDLKKLINTYTVMTGLHKHLVRAKGLLHKAQKRQPQERRTRSAIFHYV